MKHILVVLFTFLLTVTSCKSNKNEAVPNPPDSTVMTLEFLDSIAASEKIVVDNSDGFFTKLSLADMSIQMKKSDLPDDIEKAKDMYRAMLKSEMSNFEPSEKEFMEEVFASAKSALDALNPNLFPSKIELLKTKTNHYGPNVYYTRDQSIILPENIFENKSLDTELPVMVHEIFHILSRYNDDFRDKMYALIGFYKFDEELILPKAVSDKLLTNPDGVRQDYAIHLKDLTGKVERAIPLILSTKNRYTSSVPSFFGYLNFDLFPLAKLSDDQVTLALNKSGDSALSIEHNADFFELIKDNTQYIIHPDEILADNFMMAVIAHRDNNYEGFSQEGKALIMEVIEILKAFGQ